MDVKYPNRGMVDGKIQSVNACPVQTFILNSIDNWKARRHALLAFQKIAERYHDKPAEKFESDPAAKAAAQAIMDLPSGFNNPPSYRVRAARSIRVDARLIDREIELCEQKIEQLDDASTYDFSELIKARRAFDAELARLGPNAKLAWLAVAPKI